MRKLRRGGISSRLLWIEDRSRGAQEFSPVAARLQREIKRGAAGGSIDKVQRESLGMGPFARLHFTRRDDRTAFHNHARVRRVGPDMAAHAPGPCQRPPPSKQHRRRVAFSGWICRQQNLVERVFNRIVHVPGIATG